MHGIFPPCIRGCHTVIAKKHGNSVAPHPDVLKDVRDISERPVHFRHHGGKDLVSVELNGGIIPSNRGERCLVTIVSTSACDTFRIVYGRVRNEPEKQLSSHDIQ